jgi:hypothetical protein
MRAETKIVETEEMAVSRELSINVFPRQLSSFL